MSTTVNPLDAPSVINQEARSSNSMGALIQSEFYKLGKSKAFYILMAICAALAIAMAFALKSGAAMAAANPGNADLQDMAKFQSSFGGAWFVGYSLGNGLQAVIIAIFVSIFIAVEFNYGPMKNIISRGFNRTQEYLAKLITSIAAGVSLLVVYMLAGLLTGTVLWGFDPHGVASLGSLLTLFLTQALLIISYTSIFVFVAMSLRSNGASIGANISIVLMGTFVVEAINLLFHTKINFLNYWISECIKQLATLNPASADVTRGIIVAVGYTLVASILGCFLFNKQDIK